MADTTLKKLVELIGAGDSGELRRAAILVAGSVGSNGERALVKALLGALDDPDVALRTSAVEALGNLHAEEALPRLAALVQQGGPELEAAAQAACRLGKRGARAITKVLAEAPPAHRRRAAAALAHSGTDSAVVATLPALLDADSTVVDAAARSLAAEVPTFTASQRRTLGEHLIHLLEEKPPPYAPASEAAMIRVLGALHEPRAEALYWPRLDPARPCAIRAAALNALGPLGPTITDVKLPRLLACATASDFQIVAPALLILKNATVTKKNLKQWLRLLEASDVATRRFAVDKVRAIEGAEVAQALLAQTRHPDRALREEALTALRGSAAGRKVLLEALLEAPTVDEAWTVARAQTAASKELSAASRARILESAYRYHDEGDHRAEPLWFLLREADGKWLRDQIEARALALRKKRDFAGSLGYWRLVARDPACSEDVRFELAATGLKTSDHDTSELARSADPSLGQFARLSQNPEFDLLGRISKARWLDAEDLYYLGFHFASQHRSGREFGHQVLELLIERAPRTQLAKSARSKLKSEALV